MTAAGVPCFGPTAAAARLESSKAFSKDFMARHGIPTAAYRTFAGPGALPAAEAYIRGAGHRVVVKASGLAAGKGVLLPASADEAVAAVRAVLVDGLFGAAGAEVVVEEHLTGPEASVMAFCDGATVVPMPPAQDHKRAHEFDCGPNTGGMGAFAPTPHVPPALLEAIRVGVLQRAVDGLAAEGSPYVGVLYAGVMLTPAGPRVLEFNCRLGDPETQVVLPLVGGDLAEIAAACCAGRLTPGMVRVRAGVAAATVVAVAGGYPGAYAKGTPVAFAGPLSGAGRGCTSFSSRGGADGGAAADDDVLVFHAGTAPGPAGGFVTAGGRVLAVTATAPSLAGAARKAYAALDAGVAFDGMAFRRDIGGGFVRPRADVEPLRIGVLGSTRGTDLTAILDACADGTLPGARVVVVVSDVPDAGILAKAAAAGVPAVAVPWAEYRKGGARGGGRAAFDGAVLRVLEAASVDVVALVGFMRILSPVLTERFAWRLLNVHPSLLPAFAGGMDADVHAAVLAAGARETGCTVHFVDSGPVDGGPILVQRSCAVLPGDTPSALKARVQALEGAAYVEALRLFTDDAPVDLLAALRRSGGDWRAVAALLPPGRLLPPPTMVAPAAGQHHAAAPAAPPGAPLTYAAAGVDIDAGDSLVEAIKPLAKSTARTGAGCDLGGFGGLFDLKAAGYADPLLVSGTDGVGTKLRVAQQSGIHGSVGIDLVAMSVNDLIVQGAEPLVFLDYFATGHLEVGVATTVIAGIAEGCRQAGCALVGGETAEMPSMYAPGDYDLAGFAVAAVERDRVLPAFAAQVEGDVVLGLASSGVHSNGYSLVRKVVEASGLGWGDPPPYASPCATLGEDLMTPTRIYIKSLLPFFGGGAAAAAAVATPGGGGSGYACPIKGMAHITGGGLPDNVPRCMRDDLQVVLDAAAWAMPPVFRWMQRAGGGIAPFEMLRTFNCGVGMVVVVGAAHAAAVAAQLAAAGETVYTLGHTRAKPEPGAPGVHFLNLDRAFA